MEALNNLQKRNNLLKSKLLHEQLKYGNYSFNRFKIPMIKILNEYSRNNSIVKSSLMVGVNPKQVISWYVEGQKGNPQYRSFFLRLNQLDNQNQGNISQDVVCLEEEIKKNYELSQYEGSWCYATLVDGERVAFVSNDLERLKDKVKSKCLPFD